MEDQLSTSLLVLKNQELSLEIAPFIGGSIAAFYQQWDQHRFDLLRPASEAALRTHDPLGMASFPLLPFCNRIRHGQFDFYGKRVKLPPNLAGENHAIHGMAWQRPWHVEQISETAAVLSLHHQADKWPWGFTAKQEFDLRNDGFSLTLHLQNVDQEPMPFGFGHHPYFLKENVDTLQMVTRMMWLSDRENLPIDLSTPALIQEFAKGRSLDGLQLDHHFIAWKRKVHFQLKKQADPRFAKSLIMSADDPLNFLTLYTPNEENYVCVEPVSNCANWLNLPMLTRNQIGGDVLLPNETRSVTLDFQLA